MIRAALATRLTCLQNREKITKHSLLTKFIAHSLTVKNVILACRNHNGPSINAARFERGNQRAILPHQPDVCGALVTSISARDTPPEQISGSNSWV